MQLWDEFKNHTAIAILFLATGFTAGIGSYKYLSGFFNADVVLHDSYVYKSDIEKTHVPVERFAYLTEELKAAKLEAETAKKQNTQLQAAQNAMSVSVCQRYAEEANAIIGVQQRTEASIQAELSPLYGRNQEQTQLSTKRVEEARKYSELLNQQLLQIRGEIAKCGRQ